MRLNFLVGAAQLDVALERDGVVALRDGVHELVQGDGFLVVEALVEVLALKHLGDGELAEELDEVVVGQLVEPLGVEADFGLVAVEDLEDLLLVGGGVVGDLFAGERLAGLRFAGGVADERGGVADEEDDGVAELLEVAQLAHEHGVAQVEVGRCGVEAGLDAEGLAGGERLLDALRQVVERDDFCGTLGDEVELVGERRKGVRRGVGHSHLSRAARERASKSAMPDKKKMSRERSAIAGTPAAKTCAACARTIEWRKKWERDWENVRFCSDACRGHKPGKAEAAMEAKILELLRERGAGKTICPSEAARALGDSEKPESWQPLMEPARAVARRMVAQGLIVITQGGQVVEPSTAKGPIRLRLR